MPRQTAPGPLATVSASILQLRQELLAASEQRPQAARRNAALVDQVQQTLTAAVAVQAERRREVEEEASQRRRVAETRCQEHARLHSQLGTHHAEFYEEALEMALLEEEIAGQQVELASGAPTRVYEHAYAVVCPADATPAPSDHRDAPSSELQPPWALADEEVTDSLHFGWVNDAAPPRLLEEDALQRGAVPSSPPSLQVSVSSLAREAAAMPSVDSAGESGREESPSADPRDAARSVEVRVSEAQQAVFASMRPLSPTLSLSESSPTFLSEPPPAAAPSEPSVLAAAAASEPSVVMPAALPKPSALVHAAPSDQLVAAPACAIFDVEVADSPESDSDPRSSERTESVGPESPTSTPMRSPLLTREADGAGSYEEEVEAAERCCEQATHSLAKQLRERPSTEIALSVDESSGGLSSPISLESLPPPASFTRTTSPDGLLPPPVLTHVTSPEPGSADVLASPIEGASPARAASSPSGRPPASEAGSSLAAGSAASSPVVHSERRERSPLPSDSDSSDDLATPVRLHGRINPPASRLGSGATAAQRRYGAGALATTRQTTAVAQGGRAISSAAPGKLAHILNAGADSDSDISVEQLLSDGEADDDF